MPRWKTWKRKDAAVERIVLPVLYVLIKDTDSLEIKFRIFLFCSLRRFRCKYVVNGWISY
jgi:hypothetical protein